MKDNFKKPNIDFKKFKDFKVRISQIPPLDVAFQTMALSDYELLVATIYRLNELITYTNSYTELINEIMVWVVNDGLEDVVLVKLLEWKDDGTLGALINDVLFEQKLEKDTFNEFVSDVYEVFVADVDVRINDLENDLNDIENDLNNELALKADKTELTAGLDLKADKTELNDGLALKADKTYVTTQLTQTANIKANKNEVRRLDQKIEPEDLSQNSLELITGESELNLLSIPQDRSVDYSKMSDDVLGFNQYSTIPIYENDKLVEIREMDGKVVKSVIQFSYGIDDNVVSMREVSLAGWIDSFFYYVDDRVSEVIKNAKRPNKITLEDITRLDMNFAAANPEIDYVYFPLPSDATIGTTGIDYLAKMVDKNGVEMFEVDRDDRTSVNGIGGFYWSDASVSIIFEKGMYSNVSEFKDDNLDLTIYYRESD